MRNPAEMSPKSLVEVNGGSRFSGTLVGAVGIEFNPVAP